MLGGAITGLAALAVLDAILVVARAPAELSVLERLRILGVGVVCGALAGLLFGAVLVPFAKRLRSLSALRPMAVAAVGLAVGALLVDALVLVNLYPGAHWFAGFGAAVAGGLAGAVLLPQRHGPVAALAGALLSLVSPVVGPALFGDGHRLRPVVLRHGTLVARVSALWPAPAGPVALAGCTWPVPVARAATGEPAHLSVLLVTIDALRGDLGGEFLATTLPEITARLPTATRFDAAYVPATRTNMSVYSMLTGRYPHELRFRPVTVDAADSFNVLADDDPLMLDPTKWKLRHPVPVDDPMPTLAGLLTANGWETGTVIPYVFFLPAGGVTRGFTTIDDLPYQERNRDNTGVTSDLLTERAIGWLDGRTPEKPWFLWLHYMDPHAPYLPFREVPADAPAPVRYSGEIARVDAAIAPILDYLASDGTLDRTLVVLTADHGEEFGDHGGRFHGTTVYQEQAHVPLLVHVPGHTGGVVDTPVSLVDLVPTILDLLNVPTDVVFSGRSLGPYLGGPGEASVRPVLSVSALHGLRAAVIFERWKLIEDLDRKTFELFDLASDPGERANRIDAEPDTAALLRCLLDASGVRAWHPPR